jgi:hypothetical protein
MRIGFWDEKIQPVITQTPYIDGFIEKVQAWKKALNEFRSNIHQMLINGEIVVYKGSSHCRVCNLRKNGCIEIYYLQYVFPIGYLHYIIEHHIEVPLDFQTYVLETDIPLIVNKSAEEMEIEKAEKENIIYY